MTTELEQECRKWFYEMAFVPTNLPLIAMPYGYDMNYIKSLREIVGKYIKEDFDIVKGYGAFDIEIRLKGIRQNNFQRNEVNNDKRTRARILQYFWDRKKRKLKLHRKRFY